MAPDLDFGGRSHIPWLKKLFDPGFVNEHIMRQTYGGSGTEQDPFLVEFSQNDPRDPQNFPARIRWAMCGVLALVALSVNFLSSAYSAGIPQIEEDLGGETGVVALGVGLFVSGFAVGPFLWAPLSELYGRQYLFWFTYTLHTVFNAGACAPQNLASLLVIRFIAGVFGAAPLTNSGGIIADSFPPSERGLAMMIFGIGPLFGPVLGPLIGGLVTQHLGWRWLMGIMALFTAVLLIIGVATLPETYAPVLLRKRASMLSKLTGKVYVSNFDAVNGRTRPAAAFKRALTRPWALLFLEPIVLLLSLYQAITLGILYMLFQAFPFVYGHGRGWNQTQSGLVFLGPMIGSLIGQSFAMYDDRRFLRKCKADPSGFAPPEERLPPSCIGAVAIPIGLFWFAWTNSPSVNPFVSIAAGIPLGMGLCTVMVGTLNYLVDSYTIYAASVMAGSVVLRSILAGVFPTFTPYMYENLGIHWASSIPGFMALFCAPMPFLLYKYGPKIRKRCKYANEAELAMQKLRGQTVKNKTSTLSEKTTTTVRTNASAAGAKPQEPAEVV